ncbi:OmpA family protein [Sinobacterium caligoides]|uniref:OmpA family protein n=1 Tax=Sinobacterium caligoides TaxID=933926 RepID=UPI0011CDC295|nr:OmpA family protein [Sinobacterium caligoides]
MNKLLLATAVATNMLCLALQAHAEIASTAGVSVSAGGGLYSADSDRYLDHDKHYNVGLGYRFNESWEAELNYLKSSQDGDGDGWGGDADLDNYRLDGLYYFSNGAFQPYVSAGVGDHGYDYEVGGEDRDEQINLGLGAKYFFTPGFFMRADARAFDARGGVVDTAATLSLGYLFGQSPKAEPVVDGDDDMDGVANSVDQCLDSAPGAVVDSTGCDVPPEPIVMSLNVEFELSSSKIKHDYSSEIAELGALLQEHPDAEVTLVGHTDDSGAAAFNQTLSEQRAQAVADYLTENYGVDASRMDASGVGESDPIVPNDSSENRKKNRRVVVTVDTSS